MARLLPDRPGTAVALAVEGDLDLPDELRHHVDLGLDQLQRSHVAGDGTRELPPRPEPTDRVPRPVRPLENVVHRIALGGRAVAAVASAEREVAALARNGLTTTASLLVVAATSLTALTAHARSGVVRWRLGAAFALAGLVPAAAAGVLTPHVPAPALTGAFALIAACAAFSTSARISA